MTFDITQIVVAFIGVLSAVMTAFVIPWIKQKVGAEKWNQFMSIVYVAVDAAEQLGVTKVIDEKFDYAFERVKEALKAQGLKYDDETIKAAIESFVRQLNVSAVAMSAALPVTALEESTTTFEEEWADDIVEVNTTIRHMDGSVQTQHYVVGEGITFGDKGPDESTDE